MPFRLWLFLVSTTAGGAALLYALVALGWRRHGASPLDLSFLHLDWVLQPELPHWPAHVANLVIACVGLALLAAGIVVALTAALSMPGRGRQPRR